MDDFGACRSSNGEPLDLRERLIGFLREQDVMIAGGAPIESASLIRSGLLDSLALFNLVLWIEKEAGSSFDVTTVDLPREWNTVAGIVEFVQRLKGERTIPKDGAERPAGLNLGWPTKS